MATWSMREQCRCRRQGLTLGQRHNSPCPVTRSKLLIHRYDTASQRLLHAVALSQTTHKLHWSRRWHCWVRSQSVEMLAQLLSVQNALFCGTQQKDELNKVSIRAPKSEW
ncbi:hypothetical protein BaRGS_00033278 [Batillaria attramentaria]|uniref:Uncharacterized protein n=1 Tax=Batillaria attramentaria TaxID=370345 RepID=A0ABD0JKD1_9CAEN